VGAIIACAARSRTRLVDSNPCLSYSTKRIDAGYLKKRFEPQCGPHALSDIQAVEVELWLKNLAQEDHCFPNLDLC
jgi:hypothetical protein